ncbi:MAG: acylphosphatase [Chloroflexi bacterium]|nr:putative acylphosphatase [uncultured bacterium]MCX5996752.1 acylphosphatase [Chloroflexota bacterium]
MLELAHIKALVHGKVQGVYYRAFASRAAKSLSLKGYVRNVSNGDVELETEGPKEMLEELLRRLKAGPDGAIVEKIDVTWSEGTGKYSAFDVRY